MSTKNILVVDDSPTMRRMIVASLRDLKEVAFSEAGTGLEAIEHLALSNTSLMIVDLNMPEMNGMEVLAFVRKHQVSRSMPIIVLTTRGDDAKAPNEREALGKPSEGRLTLRASTVAETVMLQIEDDGRGIDAEHVARRARERGLIDEASNLSVPTLLDLICSPGFSTRQEADRAAGRGIGMAVVKNTVLSLGGTLALDTEVGRGGC